MTVDLSEYRPADYVKPGFFDQPPGGIYALAIASPLQRAGVKAEEWVGFSEELAGKLAPEYDSAHVSDSARATLREAGDRWRERCGPAAELLARSAEAVTTGKSLAGLVVHLERIASQLSLLEQTPHPQP